MANLPAAFTVGAPLDTTSRPNDNGMPQHGASQGTAEDKTPAKRPDEKRLTHSINGENYKRLTLHIT